MTSRAGGTISYYSYDLPNTINAGGLSSTFSYGANRQRWKQVATFADGTQTTIYVAGVMEKVRTPNWQGYRHYIQAGNNVVVYTRWCDGENSTFYVSTDNLGNRGGGHGVWRELYGAQCWARKIDAAGNRDNPLPFTFERRSNEPRSSDRCSRCGDARIDCRRLNDRWTLCAEGPNANGGVPPIRG
jgi:hypothetical protein